MDDTLSQSDVTLDQEGAVGTDVDKTALLEEKSLMEADLNTDDERDHLHISST